MRERVVVVGAGMVGHRFVDELVRRDRAGRFEIVVVGEEDYAPYNRILLSDVLAGRCDLAALALPEPDPARVDLRVGTAAVAVDRANRTVRLARGGSLPYDHLVLATGAESFVPPVAGLTGGSAALPRGCHVLRTLDDCRDLAARSINSRHAVVLGGGLLGLEAACGLVRRGVEVTVLHVAGHLMETQLDPAPAGVLATALDDLGVTVRIDASVVEALTEDGALTGLRLATGEVVDTDLLLVSCGVRARSSLAREAGLPCERGVLVGPDLRSPEDPQVTAIGDCAQPPEGGSGLVGPGWDQAARLAADLTGTPAPAAAGGAAPVRLKAAGVDLVTMGTSATAADPARDRVVTVSDPVGRRFVELTVRDSRVTGVTCVGAPDLAPALTVAYDRGTPVPNDPLLMLLPEPDADDGSPALMPAATSVCRCNGVTKGDILHAWEEGACSVQDVVAATRATTGCGGCRGVVCGLVDWLTQVDPVTVPGPGGTPGHFSHGTPAPGEALVAVPQHDDLRDEISAS
jgi:assimilatory nitrate reductase electron transfer subunit